MGVEQQMVMDGGQVHIFCKRWADAVLEVAVQQSSLQAQEESVGLSALFPPGAPMFASTGPQQRLQSHLHECLEVIASLPSAVLRGDETQTDTFTGDTAITASYFHTLC